MNNVEELLKISLSLLKPIASDMYLHDGSTIVGNRLLSIFVHEQQVPAIWSQCALDGGLDG